MKPKCTESPAGMDEVSHTRPMLRSLFVLPGSDRVASASELLLEKPSTLLAWSQAQKPTFMPESP